MYIQPPHDHSNLVAPFGGRGKACVTPGTCFRVHSDNYGTPPAGLNNANGLPPLLDTRTLPCSRAPNTFTTRTRDDIRLFYYQKRVEKHFGGAPSVFFLSNVRVVGGAKSLGMETSLVPGGHIYGMCVPYVQPHAPSWKRSALSHSRRGVRHTLTTPGRLSCKMMDRRQAGFRIGKSRQEVRHSRQRRVGLPPNARADGPIVPAAWRAATRAVRPVCWSRGGPDGPSTTGREGWFWLSDPPCPTIILTGKLKIL